MFEHSWLAAECFIPQLGGEDQAAATPGAVSARNTPCLVEAAGMRWSGWSMQSIVGPCTYSVLHSGYSPSPAGQGSSKQLGDMGLPLSWFFMVLHAPMNRFWDRFKKEDCWGGDLAQ